MADPDLTFEQALKDYAAAVARQKEALEAKKDADRAANSADVAASNAAINLARLIDRELPEIARELRANRSGPDRVRGVVERAIAGERL